MHQQGGCVKLAGLSLLHGAHRAANGVFHFSHASGAPVKVCQFHPVTRGLAAGGLNIRGWQPKRFGEEDALRAERVITLGCSLPTSKAFAADKLQDWNVPSPSEDYQNASRAIAERVALLLKEPLFSAWEGAGKNLHQQVQEFFSYFAGRAQQV